VVEESRGVVRLLDADDSSLSESPAEEAVDAVDDADPAPTAVVLDGTVTQRLVDVAADRGVDRVVGSDLGEFTKRPTSVRVHAAADIAL
jgi:hypothetical protein